MTEVATTPRALPSARPQAARAEREHGELGLWCTPFLALAPAPRLSISSRKSPWVVSPESFRYPGAKTRRGKRLPHPKAGSRFSNKRFTNNQISCYTFACRYIAPAPRRRMTKGERENISSGPGLRGNFLFESALTH